MAKEKTLTRSLCSKIGLAALDHGKRARWTKKSGDVCEEAANYLLGIRKGCRRPAREDGIRSGTPPEEILLSSDYIEVALHPEVAFG